MKVFISHGHDELVRRKVVDFVRTDLQLQPVVLVEQAATGRTIVEKLESEAKDVDCALILLTADDLTGEGDVRARQNVVHELGYFQGLLGRERVVIVAQEGVEWFSNLAGVESIRFRDSNIEAEYYRIERAIRQIQRLPLTRRAPYALNWTLTAQEPTALVRVHRNIAEGRIKLPVVHGANQAFLSFFEYEQGVPNPDSAEALTFDKLINGLQQRGHLADPESLMEGQQRFFQSMFMPTPPVRAQSTLRFEGHPKYGNRTFHLYLVGRGVSDEPERAEFASCLIVYLEDPTGLQLGRVSLDSLRSQNVVTVVLSKTHGQQPEPATIKVASRDAARFYGYTADAADRLKGKTLQDLLRMLQRYMDPGDFDAFVEDQARVGQDYQQYERAWARVPIKFNSRHPDDGFRNQAYYPIISHSIVETSGEDVEDYIHVLYVNLLKLLEHLPGAPSGVPAAGSGGGRRPRRGAVP